MCYRTEQLTGRREEGENDDAVRSIPTPIGKEKKQKRQNPMRKNHFLLDNDVIDEDTVDANFCARKSVFCFVFVFFRTDSIAVGEL